MENYYDVLELDKILNNVAKFCQTNYAKEQILNLKPSFEYEKTIEELNKTNDAYKAIKAYSALDLGGLRGIKDAVLRSAIGGILSEDELIDISQSVTVCENVNKYFKQLRTLKIDVKILDEIAQNLVSLPNVRSFIRNAISDDGRVMDNASKELQAIRRSLTLANAKLRSKMNELLQSRASMLSDHLIVMRNNKMCLPVKIEYKNTFKGIVLDESQSHTTVYIEPEVCYEIELEIESLTLKERKEVEAVLKSLSLVVGANSEALLKNIEILTSLDVYYAKANYAISDDSTLPIINQDNHIKLISARHPLIARDRVVPIDIELSKKNSVIVITGPNTGGKTVAIKTVGLLGLMAMCGLFIPAHEGSILSTFDGVYADIGDEQSIAQSLSTFSSHMSKLAKIMKLADFNSLVLLDEIGSGTDPKEGSALAISIIDSLKAKGAIVVATTHYSDLKNYAYQTDGVTNASVEFDSETLRPTYRLLIGIPGRSNAIDIASRLGLDAKIIENAKEYLANNNTHNQVLLETLDEEVEKMRKKEEEYHKLISEYDSKLADLNKEKEKLENDTSKIIEKSKKEAQKIINKAKDDAKEVLDELKAMKDNANSFKEHELAYAKNKVNTLQTEDSDDIIDFDLKVGDHVIIKKYDTIGEVKAIKKDKYVVNMGQFAVEFKKNELQKTTKEVIKRPKPKYKYTGENPTASAPLSLDLRGKRYEEVHDLVDSFIDQALLANRKEISIIHGFGTGAVRNAVHAYLMNCPNVERYRFGKEGEGLNGVTIVYLK